MKNLLILSINHVIIHTNIWNKFLCYLILFFCYLKICVIQKIKKNKSKNIIRKKKNVILFTVKNIRQITDKIK